MQPNNDPLVSVLMTTYNRQKYVGTAIESVLASTYSNFELIIVDDNSSDETVNIASTYASRDSRVRIYVNEKNLGDYPNRNKAASYATGEFLKYVDSDDFIYPWGLQELVDMMSKFPDSGWGLCSLLPDVRRPFPFMLLPKQAYEYHYLGPGLFHKAPLSSILKKDAFNAVGGFGTKRMVSDSEMWHKLGLRYGVVLMPDGIVWSREHNEQEVNSRHHFSEDYEKIIKHFLSLEECPLSKEDAQKILSQNRKQLRLEIFKSIIKLKPDMAKSQWNAYKVYGQ